MYRQYNPLQAGNAGTRAPLLSRRILSVWKRVEVQSVLALLGGATGLLPRPLYGTASPLDAPGSLA